MNDAGQQKADTKGESSTSSVGLVDHAKLGVVFVLPNLQKELKHILTGTDRRLI